MDETHGRITEADGVITVVLDRQDKRNAVSPQITALLWEATRALADRDDLRAMVITGVGDYFTAGIDINAVPGEIDGVRVQPDSTYRRRYRNHHLLYDEMEAVEKPIILAAQGHCLGAGVEMAASCDFRLASSSATFAMPEARLGVLPGSGGTSRVTRLVGPHWGKWLAMAAQPVDAERALMIGLVHDVYPADVFAERVEAFVQDLLSIPADCLGLTKLAVDMVADIDRTSQRHLERIANSILTGSPEFAARTARFRKSRPPAS